MGKIIPEEEFQELDEQFSFGFSLIPEFVRRFYVSNIVTRALSYIVGRHYLTGNPVALSCLSDGTLKVAVSGADVEYNDSYTGTTVDAYSAAIAFDSTVSKMDITAESQDMHITRSRDGGVTYQDAIIIYAGQTVHLESQTTHVKVKSRAAGIHTDYQIVGWY